MLRQLFTSGSFCRPISKLAGRAADVSNALANAVFGTRYGCRITPAGLAQYRRRYKDIVLERWMLNANASAVFVLTIALATCLPGHALAQINLGPLYCRLHAHDSTATNIEAFGPLFSYSTAGQARQFAVRPVLCYEADPDVESTDLDVLYPVFTCDRRGSQYRWQLLQLLNGSGGDTPTQTNYGRLTFFPVFFVQRSADPAQNYTALFPLGGKLKNRFFRDEIEFILWPLYVKTVRAQPGQPTDLAAVAKSRGGSTRATGDRIVTHNFVAPLIHVRKGPGLEGWQLWPLIGHERKVVTAYTNMWGETETVPGHEWRFFLWPIWLEQTRNIGTTNVERHLAFLPLYAQLRSANRDSTCYLWPIGLTITDDRSRKYREVGAPWPFIVFATGEGKTTRRIFPLFSQARSPTAESQWYLWPVYKRTRLDAPPLERERTRILFFLFSDTTERNTDTGASRRRTALWPLFTATRSYDGTERLQLFSILEPVWPNNSGIERNYSPLWAVWRSEKKPCTHVASQSLLWNLYRRDVSANSRKSSFLFGLFQHEVTDTQKRLRLFYIPITKRQKPADQTRCCGRNFATNAASGANNRADQ